MYQIIYDTRIEKDMRPIPKNILSTLLKKVQHLKVNSRDRGTEKLTIIEGWRLRVGDYRILYQIDDKRRIVKVYRIKHRREAYR